MKLTIADHITSSRIVGALCLLPLEVTTQFVSPFWLLFLICGITDIADGYVARKLKAETKRGAMLDSIADIVFVICCSIKLITILTVPSWIWCLVLIIATIKVINQICAWIVHRRFVFPHTSANKLTGLMLFISIPLFVCFEIFIPLISTFLDSRICCYPRRLQYHIVKQYSLEHCRIQRGSGSNQSYARLAVKSFWSNGRATRWALCRRVFLGLGYQSLNSC